ncbi:MAG: hypothetical protein RMJ17_01735 [Candidatus Aenigmarchaeota archaeon]|nr:hypothetical protein [Candidatus Aenigmarchaeota archaeon]MDW8149298.1 hypothetical protein [Candidatus Aenigmarchaeota archaeon]
MVKKLRNFLTQQKIAKNLGISQSLVSLYLNEKRGSGIRIKKCMKKELDKLCMNIVKGNMKKEDIYKKLLKITKNYYKNKKLIAPCLK